MLKFIFKSILLVAFIISPFFAPHASAAKNDSPPSPQQVTKADIKHFYSLWQGVNYRLGGNTRKGIDCSALTQRAFKKMNIRIPRTTGGQLRKGKHVPKAKLRAGDLVFFKITRNQRHVGIYVGKGKFMHASRKKGVTISRLTNKYWAKRYETSKRVSL